MSELHKFIVYEIEESGDRKKLEFQQEYLRDYFHPDKAFIIVRTDLKRIYLWKGVRANVRKRFIGSKTATKVQSELKYQGLPYCEVVAVDQGDEQEEFLNAFGLESMEMPERLPDMQYLRDRERKKLEEEKLFAKREDILKISKLDEIKNLLDADDRILWIKSLNIELNQNWMKTLAKNEKYKGRFKNIDVAKELELKNYEIRYVITEKKIISYSILNKVYDFSKIPKNIFQLKGEIAILNLKGLRSFEVEKSKGNYDVWFNAEPIKEGKGIFLFHSLSNEEYEKLIDALMIVKSFRAKIPQNLKLKYIRKGS
ncbi:MAG: hypothetical protein ACFFDO_09585 [Candidatus Thorarchaeota archaeon]